MGDLTRTLFGGSKQSASSGSSSSNQAYGALSNALTPQMNTGVTANNSEAALLGQGGDSAAASGAFNNYLNSSGYNFMLNSGSKAITNNAAAGGTLNSGATGKALTSFGQNLGTQYFNNYLGQLQGLVGNGNTAAGLISGAGNTSTSSSKSSGNSSGSALSVLFG